MARRPLTPADLAALPAGRRDRLRRRLRARDVARGIPICGFSGPNGSGKTLLAVDSAISDLAHGRPVYSTVPISSAWGTSSPVLSLRQLLELHDCTLLLDEVSAIFPSTSVSSLPEEVKLLLHTLRHRDVTVRWTSPSWSRADINLRIVTQALVNVVPLAKIGDRDTFWPRPRLVMVGVLDTSVGSVDEVPTKVRRRALYVPRWMSAWGAYDSMADTPRLGFARSLGSCPDCGGRMDVPRHSPERHLELGLPWYADEAPAVVPASEGIIPIAGGTAPEVGSQGWLAEPVLAQDRAAPLTPEPEAGASRIAG